MVESKNLELLRQVCLLCGKEEKEKYCSQGFGEDKFLLPLQRIKVKRQNIRS